MEFVFDKSAWTSLEEGEKNCYLMSNGLGGYSSMNLLGGVTRGDQAFFMASKKAPNVRWNMITGLLETLYVDEKAYVLTSQRMKHQPDLEGYCYLKRFVFDNYPEWEFEAGGVTVKKKMVMAHGENTVAVRYEIIKPVEKKVTLSVKPLLRVTAKNTPFQQSEASLLIYDNGKITKEETTVYVASNGSITALAPQLFGALYFSQDERDGRESAGFTVINHEIVKKAAGRPAATEETGTNAGKVTPAEAWENEVLDCIFGMKPVQTEDNYFEMLLSAHQEYISSLLKKTRASSELGRQLSVSADAYVSERESTGGKTILAGFPFFEDWGRDTMIALPGITMVTGRFEECKSILRTFAKYVKNGLLPNLFPEGDCNPMYNSVDAPLLFVNAAYEYVRFSGDEAFVEEIFPVLEQIIDAYKTDTDFHICMDSDSLIQAGAELEQLTWMDVRVGDYLPTPRHGKPVEINAYWYSALKVMEEFAKNLLERTNTAGEYTAQVNLQNNFPNYALKSAEYGAKATEYAKLAEQVKTSFVEKFWNVTEQCLKDVLSGNSEENQVRCNQIWALTQPFRMLDTEKERLILQKVREELYTTVGLRTLSPKDAAFHEIYIGSMQQRDRAYHQGTVWAFPLGAYYRACIRLIQEQDFREKTEWQQHVTDGIQALQDWLAEGCVAQVAEIYDGRTPTVSRGCYAQAWSVGELLRAVYEYENWNSSKVTV